MPVEDALIDNAIAAIDVRLSAQLDEILHHRQFQALEAAWRSLRYLVDRVDFRENVRVEFLNCSKSDLTTDLSDRNVARSGFYRIVYERPYGVRSFVEGTGDLPYGLLVGGYEFGPDEGDIEDLTRIAWVASLAHVPFIAGAAPAMCGLDSWEELADVTDLPRQLAEPGHAAWLAFRERPWSNHIGLCLPRFLLRAPYDGADAQGFFRFVEDVGERGERGLWGSAAVALAASIADAFARYRLCANIIGPQSGGALDGVPTVRHSIECELSERREFELSEAGLIGLSFSPQRGFACFLSANSCQKPRYFGRTEEGRAAEITERLVAQLPYLLVLSRVAQYLKVIYADARRSGVDREEAGRALDDWLSAYTADMDDHRPRPVGPKFFTTASVRVEVDEQLEDRMVLRLRPQFRNMGNAFTLALTGRLERPPVAPVPVEWLRGQRDGPRVEAFRALSTSQLVELMVDSDEYYPDVMDACVRREADEPDADATARIVRAYNDGRMFPSVASELLCLIGHPSGLSTARRLVKGKIGERSAASAIVRMVGQGRMEKLVSLMRDDPEELVRAVAARALGRLGTSRVVSPLRDAVRAGRIMSRTARQTLLDAGVDDDTLAGWLRSGLPSDSTLACEVLFEKLERRREKYPNATEPAAWLAPLAIAALPLAGRSMLSYQREAVQSWAERVTPHVNLATPRG